LDPGFPRTSNYRLNQHDCLDQNRTFTANSATRFRLYRKCGLYQIRHLVSSAEFGEPGRPLPV